ncbi:MAG TPA: hypothetical protein DEA22_13755 [Blastocatellia bacterium]|nr:hypothetical protein [Blastocatellia bacterium]
MRQIPSKYAEIIKDAVERLLASSDETYGIGANDLLPRIEKALEQYLFSGNFDAGRVEIESFIGEIRVEELCLITACERGDENAWRELSSRFDSAVRSAARRITANNEDADDLANSIWAELYGLSVDSDGKRKSKLAYYSGRGSLAGWLRAVAAQLAVDNYRKQARIVQIDENREFEILANEAANADGRLFSQAPNPEAIFAEKRMAADVIKSIQRAMNELAAEDRLVLKLYYFDNLKLKEIGAAFGYHEATASRKLVRIQGEIRKSVEESLRRDHGWKMDEVKRYLAETAEKLGVDIAKMLGMLLTAAMQVFFN